MTTPQELWDEAWSWRGTPFQWQGRRKGEAADCFGLVVGAAREKQLPEADSLYAAICDYTGLVPVTVLRRGLAETLRPVRGALQLADVLLLNMAGKAQHLAFWSPHYIVHTYSSNKPVAVTHNSTAAALKLWPLVSAWRFGSLEPAGG